jgi:hypothetical protein
VDERMEKEVVLVSKTCKYEQNEIFAGLDSPRGIFPFFLEGSV